MTWRDTGYYYHLSNISFCQFCFQKCSILLFACFLRFSFCFFKYCFICLHFCLFVFSSSYLLVWCAFPSHRTSQPTSCICLPPNPKSFRGSNQLQNLHFQIKHFYFMVQSIQVQSWSSHQLLGDEKVFESLHLPETHTEQQRGLDHGPPQHLAVGVLTDQPEQLLLLLNDAQSVKKKDKNS